MARADGDDDENVSTTRPLSTGASHRACSRGCDTKTLRVWCPRAAAPGSAKNKGRGDSTGSADRSIKQCGIGREVPADHEAQGQKCSDGCRSQESEVADVRRTSAREENGLVMNQETSTAVQGQKVYKLNGLEALGNKASPRERCLRGQRRRCFAQDSAGMDGLRRKTAREGNSRTQERKEQPLRERTDLQLVRRA